MANGYAAWFHRSDKRKGDALTALNREHRELSEMDVAHRRVLGARYTEDVADVVAHAATLAALPEILGKRYGELDEALAKQTEEARTRGERVVELYDNIVRVDVADGYHGIGNGPVTKPKTNDGKDAQ